MYGAGTTAMITMGQSYASSARWAQRFKGKAWVLDRVVAAIDGGVCSSSFPSFQMFYESCCCVQSTCERKGRTVASEREARTAPVSGWAARTADRRATRSRAGGTPAWRGRLRTYTAGC